jgi:adenine/guanine/hypoxanthine permease
LVLIPFSYSITQGIIFGFLSWTILKTAVGKGKEISFTLWMIDIFAVMSLVWGH